MNADPIEDRKVRESLAVSRRYLARTTVNLTTVDWSEMFLKTMLAFGLWIVGGSRLLRTLQAITDSDSLKIVFKQSSSPSIPRRAAAMSLALIVGASVSPAAQIEIRYPHCIVESENLPKRSLNDAIAQFNHTSLESPVGLRQPPITEQETRDAIEKFIGEPHVVDSVRTQLREILKSGNLPPNVYFRRFTRFDDEQQMRGVWWVRLCVEGDAPPMSSVPVRTTDHFTRPYTQLERQQNAEPGVTLINRFSSYFEDVPNILLPVDFPDGKEKRLIDRASDSIANKDIAAFESLFDWKDVSDSIRAFVKTEFQTLAASTIHGIKITPRNFRGELLHWSAYQYYQPNLPVVGYLEIEYSPTGDHAVGKKILSLEMGDAGADFRLVNYIETGKRNLPTGKVMNLSMRGHIELLADGTFLVTSIITNPDTLISGHLANEEIWQRDYNKTARKTGKNIKDKSREPNDPKRDADAKPSLNSEESAPTTRAKSESEISDGDLTDAINLGDLTIGEVKLPSEENRHAADLASKNAPPTNDMNWIVSPQVCRGKTYSSTAKAAEWKSDEENRVVLAAIEDGVMNASVLPHDGADFVVNVRLRVADNATCRLTVGDSVFDISNVGTQARLVFRGTEHRSELEEKSSEWILVTVRRRDGQSSATLNNQQAIDLGTELKAIEHIGIQSIQGTISVSHFVVTGNVYIRK
ncbi:hypothetical protein SH528x_003675 [Novipirellula sp. SH528]|uniref:hypothetical protein n=1 Tax=Novipirellula sp. SH528 TaxID=3454466 RepID=UPI003F9F9081